MKMKLIALAAALAASSSASAQTSATLNVTGTITPPSCSMNLAHSQVNLGHKGSAQLNATAPTKFSDAATTVTVACGANTQFALNVNDERAGSVAAGAVRTASTLAQAGHAFGLGEYKGNPIGAYVIELEGVMAGTSENMRNTSFIADADKNGAYQDTAFLTPGMFNAWKSTETQGVASVQHATANLIIRAAVMGTDAIGMDGEVTLDGRATVELEYL